MTYITTVNGLEFYAHHGLYAEERLIGGIFRVDMKVSLEKNDAINSLEEAVNYEWLVAIAKEEMDQPNELIETVAQNILKRIQNLHVNARSIEVTIHKPNPAGLFKSGEASVTLAI